MTTVFLRKKRLIVRRFLSSSVNDKYKTDQWLLLTIMVIRVF